MLSIQAMKAKKRQNLFQPKREIILAPTASQEHLKRVILMKMSLSPSVAFKKALSAYHDSIQNQANRSQRHDFLEIMSTSFKACPPSAHCSYASDEFVLALEFVKLHAVETLNGYAWLKHLTPEDEQCFEIELELIDSIVDFCFFIYSKSNPVIDHESILFAHYYSVARSSALLFNASVKLLQQLQHQTLSIKEQVTIAFQIDRFLKKIGAAVEAFALGTAHIKSDIILFVHTDLSNVLFRQHLMSAEFQLICKNQEKAAIVLAACEAYQAQIKVPKVLLTAYAKLKQDFYDLFICPLRKDATPLEVSDIFAVVSSVKKSKKKKKKSKKNSFTETVHLFGSVDNSPPDGLRPAACPLDSEIVLNAQYHCTEIERSRSSGQAAGPRALNCQQTDDNPEVFSLNPCNPSKLTAPSLNPLAPSWIGQPMAYKKNPQLRDLLHEMSLLFKRSLCEGLIYGSSITDEEPGDIDVLVPNIVSETDRGHVNDLILLFIQHGAVVTAFTDRAYGYTKFNRHIIPVVWRDFKIEFSITHMSYQQHAQTLDFTIRALYFNLNIMRLLSVDGIPALQDFNSHRIQTISPPSFSFRADPIRIFRAIRLIAKGLKLSDESYAAIRDMFSGEDNPFAMINVDKLCYHLSVLLEPRYAEHSMDILQGLGLFLKLFECFNHNYCMDVKLDYYKQSLMPFYSKYFSFQEPFFMMTPYNFFQCTSRGQQPVFYSAPVSTPPVPLMAWYPAST